MADADGFRGESSNRGFVFFNQYLNSGGSWRSASAASFEPWTEAAVEIAPESDSVSQSEQDQSGDEATQTQFGETLTEEAFFSCLVGGDEAASCDEFSAGIQEAIYESLAPQPSDAVDSQGDPGSFDEAVSCADLSSGSIPQVPEVVHSKGDRARLVPFGPPELVEPLDLHQVITEMPTDMLRWKFRRPDILGAALDFVGAYIKELQIEKAQVVLEIILPVCREFGGLFHMQALNHMALVRMNQGRPAETLALLTESQRLAQEHLHTSKKKSWQFWETLYRNFSWCHGALHNQDEAAKYCQKAIDVKELAGQPVSWFDLWELGRNKATMALVSNDPEKIRAASQTLEKSLKLHHQDEVNDLVMRAKIWHTVGECSFALGHIKHCGKGVDQVVDIDSCPLTDDAKALYKRALKSFQQAYRLFIKAEGRTNALTGREAEAITWTLVRLRDYEDAKPFMLNALEAQCELLNDLRSGRVAAENQGYNTSTSPALLRSMQTVDHILEAHRCTDDRAGLQRYFDAIEKLCDNACCRMHLLPKDQEKKDAQAYERLISSCSMILVASGTPDGMKRSQKVMNTRMREKPKTAHAKVCEQMFETLATEGPSRNANVSTPEAPSRQVNVSTSERVPKAKTEVTNHEQVQDTSQERKKPARQAQKSKPAEVQKKNSETLANEAPTTPVKASASEAPSGHVNGSTSEKVPKEKTGGTNREQVQDASQERSKSARQSQKSRPAEAQKKNSETLANDTRPVKISTPEAPGGHVNVSTSENAPKGKIEVTNHEQVEDISQERLRSVMEAQALRLAEMQKKAKTDCSSQRPAVDSSGQQQQRKAAETDSSSGPDNASAPKARPKEKSAMTNHEQAQDASQERLKSVLQAQEARLAEVQKKHSEALANEVAARHVNVSTPEAPNGHVTTPKTMPKEKIEVANREQVEDAAQERSKSVRQAQESRRAEVPKKTSMALQWLDDGKAQKEAEETQRMSTEEAEDNEEQVDDGVDAEDASSPNRKRRQKKKKEKK